MGQRPVDRGDEHLLEVADTRQMSRTRETPELIGIVCFVSCYVRV